MQKSEIVLVGEVFVDVTITPPGQENKLRFGGIIHAARGLWALGIPFGAAIVVPKYLEEAATQYLASFGCTRTIIIGYVSGAPNITLIFDPTEIGDQGYDTLLRDEKTVDLVDIEKATLADYSDALVIPGTYNLQKICQLLPQGIRIHIDVAYDVKDANGLRPIGGRIDTIFISTSSDLFREIGGKGITPVAKYFASLKPKTLVLKENRGGSRVHVYGTEEVISVPARIGDGTVNSVGVGDVYDATYIGYRPRGVIEASFRAAAAAAAYAATTEPDTFRDVVQRDILLTAEELRDLGGVQLPWDGRHTHAIYLAAPDFSLLNAPQIEQAVSALRYHNFNIRRPVKENGELPAHSDFATLQTTYQKDIDLLRSCALVFAIPIGRDPGTLVELGFANALNIPIIVYDPLGECSNTMVIAGSSFYARDLESCLNAVFDQLSKRKQ